MSRLTTLSPAALKAFFSPESSDTLITLVEIFEYDDNTASPVIRIADNFTGRLTSFSMPVWGSLDSDEDVLYGVTSGGNSYIFLPVNISLPSEEDQGIMPKCSMTINDVTRYLTPLIRTTIKKPPKVTLKLVLKSTPDTVEASFPGFYINSITYSADTVQFDISMLNYQNEPFPCFTFSPKYFPGLF